MSLPETIDPDAGRSLASARHDPAIPETIIERRRGWRALNLGEIWEYRELLYFLAWRDVKVRYKQTVLGAAWAVLQPVMMMVVFTILFSRLAGVSTGNIPYPLFVYIGLLPWSFFAISLGSAGASVIDSERLVTKVYFPRLLIPFGAVGAALVDLAVGSGFLIVLLAYNQVVPTALWLLIPLIVSGFVLAALGAGTLLAALNVRYRDFRYIIPFLVQLWMFATPSIFLDVKVDGIDTASSWLLRLSPLNGLVAAFRAVLLGTEISWLDAAVSFAWAAAMFVVGTLAFRRLEGTFTDTI